MCSMCRSEEGFSLIGTKDGGCSCLCKDVGSGEETKNDKKSVGRCNGCGHKVRLSEQG